MKRRRLRQWQIICDPTAIVQGHALWHILGAFAAYGIIEYYYPKTTDKVA